MGITRPGAVSVTLGTSGVVFAATDRPSLDPGGRLHTFCHAIPGRWHVMGVTQAAGLSLRWIRDQFAQGQRDYSRTRTKEAATVPPGCGRSALGALPNGRTNSASRFFRPRGAAWPRCQHTPRPRHASRHGRRGLQPARYFTIFAELGVPVNKVRVTGGGARSKLWRQIQADVYGHAVGTIAAEEGGAYGAALLAGVGTGVPWPTRRRIGVATSAYVQPAEVITLCSEHAQASSAMDKQYERYSRVLSGPESNITNHERSIYAPPRTQVFLWSLDRRQSRPRSFRRAGAPIRFRLTSGRHARRSRRLGRESP